MPAPPSPRRMILSAAISTLAGLALMGLAWGSIPSFFADPARAIVTVLLTIPGNVVARFTSLAGKGVRHVEERGFVLIANILFSIGLLGMVLLSARGIGLLPGGGALRGVGVVVTLVGTIWRVGPMIALGRRFSLAVAVQDRHVLETRGFYAHVRHPSYLGMILMMLGVALVFESVLGLGLTLATAWITIGRMRREDAFLAEEFPDEYPAYAARTKRLIPGVY